MFKKAMIQTVLAICAATAWGGTWANSDLSGKVQTVNVNEGWGGFSIQLVNASIFEPGSPCANSWAFVENTNPYAAMYLSAALAAKATGETVRIGTNGCVASKWNGTPAPRVYWIDLGIRLGG